MVPFFRRIKNLNRRSDVKADHNELRIADHLIKGRLKPLYKKRVQM